MAAALHLRPATLGASACRLSSFSPRTRAPSRWSTLGLPLGQGQLNTCTLFKILQAPTIMDPRLSHGRAICAAAANRPFVPDDPDRAAEFEKLIEKLKKMAEKSRKDIPFREEIVKMDEFDFTAMTPCDSSFLHIGAKTSSIQTWCLAHMAIILASDVMVCAGLRLGMPEEISLDTIKQTLSIYVCIFVSTFDDACQRKTTKETFVSFLDAIGGVVAISHILLQDTLANLNDNGDSSAHRSLGCEVDRARDEFQQKLNSLKHEFMTAPLLPAYLILIPTLLDAIILADLFVMNVRSCLRMVVSKAQGDKRD